MYMFVHLFRFIYNDSEKCSSCNICRPGSIIFIYIVIFNPEPATPAPPTTPVNSTSEANATSWTPKPTRPTISLSVTSVSNILTVAITTGEIKKMSTVIVIDESSQVAMEGRCSIWLDIFSFVFSSPELKAQVSFSDHLSSVVCPSVCLSVRPSVKFSHFHLLLQNHWTNFNQTWHKASLGKGD